MHNASINYFDEIASACELLEGSAKAFNALLGNFGPSALDAAAKEQGKARGKMRSDCRSVETALYHDFITPIEREDIIAVMSAADSVSCGFFAALSEMRVWGIAKSRGEAIEFSDAAYRCLAKIKKLSKNLEKFRKDQSIIKSVREASDLAGEGGRLYAEAMSALTRESANTNELLAWSRIYGRMEELLSKCAFLADTIAFAIIKNI